MAYSSSTHFLSRRRRSSRGRWRERERETEKGAQTDETRDGVGGGGSGCSRAPGRPYPALRKREGRAGVLAKRWRCLTKPYFWMDVLNLCNLCFNVKLVHVCPTLYWLALHHTLSLGSSSSFFDRSLLPSFHPNRSVTVSSSSFGREGRKEGAPLLSPLHAFLSPLPSFYAVSEGAALACPARNRSFFKAQN